MFGLLIMNACLPFIDACVWYVISLRSQAEIWRQNRDPTLVSEAQFQMLEVGQRLYYDSICGCAPPPFMPQYLCTC